MDPVLIVIGVVIFVVFLMFAGLTVLEPAREGTTIEERLRAMARDPSTIDLQEIELAKPFSERVIYPFVDKVSTIIKGFTPKEVENNTRSKLIQAGIAHKIKPLQFITIKYILAVGVPIFFLAIGTFKTPEDGNFIKPLFQLVLLVGVLFAMPEFWLRSQISQRQAIITRMLPDALDLMTISVEAGLGFDAAIGKVTEKFEGPIAEEFAKALHEMRMGKPRREALKDMAVRNDVPDLSQFISALVQADKLGVSIANVLRVQSDQMRLKRKQRAEEQAMKAPIKMSIVMVFFIFPTIMIILLGPAMIALMQTLSGVSQ
jgi:tight adherence protein C